MKERPESIVSCFGSLRLALIITTVLGCFLILGGVAHGGTLNLNPPSSATFSSVQLTGSSGTLDDGFATTVDDETGTGNGWSLTAAASGALSCSSGLCTGMSLPSSALSFNGSTTGASATTAPSLSCSVANSCTLANNAGITYPITVPTTGSAVILNAGQNTGMGSQVASLNLWLTFPAATLQGTYSTTLTLTASSGPSLGGGSSSLPPQEFVSPSINDSTTPNAYAVGDVLSTTTGTWANSPTSYSYQWQYSPTSGGSYTAIGGATSASYTIPSTYLGDYLKVVVTATNSSGGTSAPSAPTPQVAGVPLDTVLPAISGTVYIGDNLSVSNGTWLGSPTAYSYQWYDCTSTSSAPGSGCSAIGGATSPTYTLASSDYGYYILAAVKAANSYGSSTANSTTTTLVPGISPSFTSGVTISGTAVVGNTLTSSAAAAGYPSPTLTYQWKYSTSSGGSYSSISGATNSSYVISSTYANDYLELVVSATNGAGTATSTSSPTAQVGGSPVNSAVPTISGTTVAGKVLTATSGSWNYSPTSYSYQWEACSGSGGTGCSNIGGATSSTYTLGSDETLTNDGTAASGTSPLSIAYSPNNQWASVANKGSNTIQTYSVNSTTGVLTSLATVATAAQPYSATYSPNGQWVAIVDYGATEVQTFSVNQTTGALTAAGSATTGTNPISVVWSPNGSDVSLTNQNSATVQTFSVNQTTGVLTAVGSVATGTSPAVLSYSPNGNFLSVANVGSNNIQTYSVSPTTGALTSIGTAAAGTGPTSIAYSPTGLYASASNEGGTTVQTYSVNQTTGALTSIATVAAGTSPNGVAYSPNGQYLAVANFGSATLQTYLVNQSSGALTSLGTVATGTNPYMVTYSPNGNFVAVPNLGSATVQTYSTSPSDVGDYIVVSVTATNASGSSSAQSSPTSQVVATPINTTASSIVGIPTVNQTLIANQGTWANYPSSYSYQWADCTGISGSQGTGCSNISGATSASYTLQMADVGDYIQLTVVAANAASSSAGATGVTSTTATTLVGSYSVGATSINGINGVAYSPNGSWIAATNSNAAKVDTYSVNPTTGALTTIGAYNTGTTPGTLSYFPNDNYLAVLNTGASSIDVYSVNAATGALGVGRATTALGSSSMAISPNGSYLAVGVNGTQSSVEIFSINASTGGLTEVGDYNTIAGHFTPNSLSFSPNSSYLAVANNYPGLGGVETFSVGTTGALTEVGSYTAGTETSAVAWAPSGNYLASDNVGTTPFYIEIYSVASGALTEVGTTTTSFAPTSNGLVFSPNGNFLGASTNNSTQLYSVGSGESLTSFATVNSGTSTNEALAFSPLGSWIASGNAGTTGVLDISAY